MNLAQHFRNTFHHVIPRQYMSSSLHQVGDGLAVAGCAHQSRPPRPERLRVALLGCGAVGRGVLDYLLARPDLFEVRRQNLAIHVRDKPKAKKAAGRKRATTAK